MDFVFIYLFQAYTVIAQWITQGFRIRRACIIYNLIHTNKPMTSNVYIYIYTPTHHDMHAHTHKRMQAQHTHTHTYTLTHTCTHTHTHTATVPVSTVCTCPLAMTSICSQRWFRTSWVPRGRIQFYADWTLTPRRQNHSNTLHTPPPWLTGMVPENKVQLEDVVDRPPVILCRGGSIGGASDLRSEDPRFEPRHENKKNLREFFPPKSKMLCGLVVSVPNPCVYRHA